MEKRWGKRFLCLIMTVALIITLLPTAAFADPLSQGQIVPNTGGTRYYDKNQNEVTTSPRLGVNSVVSVAKTIEGTDIENEFIINLDVRTSVDISNVKLSSDAAVVLVLDISDSMNQGSNQAKYINVLKAAAANFVKSYAAGANGANRYISLVTFNDTAKIEYGWMNVSDAKNLQDITTKIGGLTASGFTFMEGGLLFARNLLRTDGFPADRSGQPIENRSVIVFSDGIANRYLEKANSNQNINSKETNAQYPTNPRASYSSGTAETRAAAMAQAIKNGSSVPVNNKPQTTYDARLYAIGFGSGAPASWLRGTIASGTSHYYAASDAASLNTVFDAINLSIERWAEAWTVQDPMGENIEFIETIEQNDLDAGILKFENNLLEWNLKKASASSFANNVYSFSYQYRIRLDNTAAFFVPDTDVVTNGVTKLQYVMVEDGTIVGNVLTAEFPVPKVRGYHSTLTFTKVGDDGARLAGCEFLLENQTAGKPSYTAVSGTDGKVSFSGIPSGYTYTLTETALPDTLSDRYFLSTDPQTVTVALGVLTMNNAPVSDYEFVNKSKKTDFIFTKIDGNIYAQKNEKISTLAGAEFSIFRCSDLVKGQLVPTDVINGTSSSDWKLYGKAVSSDKGVVTLSLEKGSYMLVETKAPFVKGSLITEEVQYQLPYGQWSLTVDASQAQPVRITAVADSNGQLPPAFVQPKDTKDTHKLQNMRVHDLPLTGGPGVALFIGIGSALLVTGAVLLVLIIRRSRSVKATAWKQ